MAKEDRGFATLILTDPEKQREISSRGGRAAHLAGTAHEWASGKEAEDAGRKGGLAKARNGKEANPSS